MSDLFLAPWRLLPISVRHRRRAPPGGSRNEDQLAMRHRALQGPGRLDVAQGQMFDVHISRLAAASPAMVAYAAARSAGGTIRLV
ncbi:MAG TPA: hypothetical protein VFC16_05710 [Nakamurella sp.]|nr:hypothetical protein [Nakamurella sp.]